MMYRLLGFSVIALVLTSAHVEAVEMFTNFHYGENVGFPPMQVPYGIYGGLGRGGWNPDAEGMPLKSLPDTPSMMPTGQNPGGFRRFTKTVPPTAGNAARSTPQNTYRNAANPVGQSNRDVAESQSEPATPQFSSRRLRDWPQQLAATPRRRWLRGGSSTADSTGNGTTGPRLFSGNAADQPLQPVPPKEGATTVLHASEATPPASSSDTNTLQLPE
jgi:hypothetical protein